MVYKSILLVLGLSTWSLCDTGFYSTINVTETDNSPKCQVGQIKVSTGTLTCNGQVATIAIGAGGGAATTPASPSGSLQYNNAGSFGAIPSAVTSSSLTITKSSFSFNTTGVIGVITTPGTFDLFDNSSYIGKPIFRVGTQNLNNLFTITDGAAPTFSYGLAPQGLQLGFPATPTRIGTDQSANNYIDIYNGDGVTGEMLLRTGAAQTRDIVFAPETIPTVRLSSNSMIVTSSIAVIAPVSDSYIATFSTYSAGPYILGISSSGHINSQVVSGSTVTSCGTAPILSGSDNAGTITVGSGVILSCTLAFAKPWVNAPSCVMTINTTGITGGITTLTNAQAVFSFSATVAGGIIWYHCIGSD